MKTTIFLLLIASAFCPGLKSQWVQLNSGTNTDLKSIFFLNTNTGYVSGSAGTVLKTTNAGSNWSAVPTGISENINSVYFLTPQSGYACGNAGKIIYTSNGGANWLTAQTNVTDNLFSIHGNFCAGAEGTLLFTTNGGMNWQVASNGFFATNYYAISSLSASNAVACGVNAIFQPLIARTTNGGVNWSYSTFYLNGNEGNLRDIHYVNSNNVLAAANVWDGTGAIALSTNGGVNWSAQIFTSALNTIDMAGSNGFAAGFNGYVIRSTNEGLTWSQSQTGLNTVFRSVDVIDSLNAYICGDGGVIIKTTTGGITSLQTIANEIPNKFSLSQNYPNPFNPLTTIRFQIPLSSSLSRPGGRVTAGSGRGVLTFLSIYDISGKEVATLINQQLTPGTYSVDWNASNHPSGVYFYRLSSGEFTQTNKMILIK